MPDDPNHGWTALADLTPKFNFESGRPQQPKPGTRRKQIEDLIAAREADPEAGFITRILLLCTLPRTDPRRRLQYVRRNGPYSLIMTATGGHKLPYGTLPRLLLAWACTEAVRTHSRTLVLGRSLSEFMRKLGINPSGCGKRGSRTVLINQMARLFGATIHLAYDGPDAAASITSPIAERTWFLWDRRNDKPLLWESTVTLGGPFFQEILAAPVPIDLFVLRAMKRSSLGLDLYMWLTYRTFNLERPLRLSWKLLYRQFAHRPETAGDKFAVRNFRKDACRELLKLKLAWPGLQYGLPPGHLEIRPSEPPIPCLPCARGDTLGSMALDTHAAVRALTSAGASEDLAVAARTDHDRELVTRADLRAEIAALELRLIKWIIGTGIVVAGAVIAALRLLD